MLGVGEQKEALPWPQCCGAEVWGEKRDLEVALQSWGLVQGC